MLKAIAAKSWALAACLLNNGTLGKTVIWDNPENTHLLHKGKYHYTADLLFDWFGFSCFVEFEL